MKINDGQIDDFRKAAAKLGEVVAEKDTKTTDYAAFIDEDTNTGIMFEGYESSEGVLEHIEHLTPYFQLIFDVCKVETIELYGEFSPEAWDQLKEFEGEISRYDSASSVAA